MIIPPYLVKGNKIAVIAPARKISIDELSPALEQIRNWGFEPVLGKHVFATHHQFAGTDDQRLEDLQWAFDDNEIKAIIAARGGYGCLRIVDDLDLTQFKKNTKWLVGYSDITVFHSLLAKNNVASIHATMPINFSKSEEATKSLFNTLTGNGVSYKFKNEILRPSNIAGNLVGGNLSLLYSMMASPTDVDTNGKILFVEDLDEYLYHIDRMIIALKRAGKLKNLKALLVGSFTEIKDNLVPFGKTAHEIILSAVKDYDYPVYFGFPAGHQDLNLAITYGKSCTIKIEDNYCIFRQ